MRIDDAVKEVRRLIWAVDLDHRQIIAIAVVCDALDGHRIASVPGEVLDQVTPSE